MKILLFGASGMIGQGVLRECLLAQDVALAQSIVRSPSGQAHPKLREIVHRDFLNFDGLKSELKNFDACFFCLGISSAGMTEADYVRTTFDITMAVANILVALNPSMTFVYVSGRSTDNSEAGTVMWARIKGKTENALRKLPFKAVYLFRPGIIQPLRGIRSKTRSYRIFYTVTKPLLWLVRTISPASVLTTESIGIAMLNAARRGAPKAVLEVRDIRELATSTAR